MYSRRLREAELLNLAQKLGGLLKGGEVIELVGDVGAGKTTFTRGLARGLGIEDDIQSPTFTISRLYEAPGGIRLAHYDFYRLVDAGILTMELEETIADQKTITVIEWGEIITGVLPENRLTVRLNAISELTREVSIEVSGEYERRILKDVL